MSTYRGARTKILFYVICTMLGFGMSTVSSAAVKPFVFLQDGQLKYTKYANEGQRNRVNVVPDFSYAGYRGGGVAIPHVDTVEFLLPVTGDNRKRIQDAIDRVSALPLQADGFRGAVELGVGEFEVEGSLLINTSGVVLRGQGQRGNKSENTVIRATAKYRHELIRVRGNGVPSEQRIEAEDLDSYGVDIGSDGSRSVVENVQQGDYLLLRNVDTNSLGKLQIQLKSSNKNAKIIVKVDSPDGDTVGVFNGELGVDHFTKDSNYWLDEVVVLDGDLSGIRDLYLTFSGENEIGAVDYIELKYLWHEVPGSRQSIVNAMVPSGVSSFKVQNGSTYAVGDTVVVVKTVNDAWIKAIGAAEINWHHSFYDNPYERVITAVKGNRVSIDIPIVDPIERRYGGGAIYRYEPPHRVSRVGVEKLRLLSDFDSKNSQDENHGWVAVGLNYAENSWVRDVSARYFGNSGVSIAGFSRFNTVQNFAQLDPVSIITGRRRYSFALKEGAYGNLFQRCFSRGGRHDFVTGRKVVGPNVWLDCYAVNTYSDSGPHGRWATGSLYDNVRSGRVRVRDRSDGGTGQGWAGAQNMLWNAEAEVNEGGQGDGLLVVQSPVGAKNWAVGPVSANMDPAGNPSGHWESVGSHVFPRSLYLQQLEDRLGYGAVLDTTTEIQRSGALYALLKKWEGKGELPSSIVPERLDVQEDAYVKSWDQMGNFNDEVLVVQRIKRKNKLAHSFLKFDLLALTRGNIVSAKLNIYLESDVPSNTLQLYDVVDDNWLEGDLNWENKPASSLSSVGTTPVNLSGWYSIDITEYLRDHADSTVSIVMQNKAFNKVASVFSSKEAAGNAPYLSIRSYSPN